MPRFCSSRAARGLTIGVLAIALSACAVAPVRNEDPWQGFNRKMFAFNRFADKVAIKPVAQGYMNVTTPQIREHVGDFFTNARAPITIVNEFLQGRPGPALDAFTRFAINTTAGLLGIFDPATKLNVPQQHTDFGVTLADWGVPQGPYLVLPFFGPSTVRDVWRYPADLFANPLYWYARNSGLPWYEKYAPEALYLVQLRANLLPFDKMLDSSFDPYAFMRDVYLQRRLDMIYHGNPPLSAIEQFQGTTPSEQSNQDIEQLLQQQKAYEKTHGAGSSAEPAAAGSSAPAPATTSPSATPAAAASAPIPASSTH